MLRLEGSVGGEARYQVSDRRGARACDSGLGDELVLWLCDVCEARRRRRRTAIS